MRCKFKQGCNYSVSTVGRSRIIPTSIKQKARTRTKRLYTLYGALVGSQKVWNTGDISVSMPLNNLLNGIFAYSITDDTETVQATGKLVVSE